MPAGCILQPTYFTWVMAMPKNELTQFLPMGINTPMNEPLSGEEKPPSCGRNRCAGSQRMIRFPGRGIGLFVQGEEST